MTLSRLLARPMLTSIFVVGPAKTLQDPKPAAERADRVTRHVVATLRKLGVQAPEDPLFWVRLNAGVQLVAAAGLATGKMPRLSAAVLATSLVPTTVAGHDFWNESDPAVRNQQLLQWAKNVSILGGLVIAANDTDGRPGLAWRAHHAADTAKLEARMAAMDAGISAGMIGSALAAAGRHAKETLHQAATSDTAHRLADRASELAGTAREQAPAVAKDARKTYRRQRKHLARELADIRGR